MRGSIPRPRPVSSNIGDNRFIGNRVDFDHPDLRAFYQARLIVEDLRNVILSQPVEWRGLRIPLAASFGISETRAVGDEPVDTQTLFVKVFKRADDALFQAKHEGRNRIV